MTATALQGEKTRIKACGIIPQTAGIKLTRNGCSPIGLPVVVSVCDCHSFIDFDLPCLDKGIWNFEIRDENNIFSTGTIHIK